MRVKAGYIHLLARCAVLCCHGPADCYMMENADEYWAEGCQSWFEATVRTDVNSGINTRERLKQHDPDLALLLSEASLQMCRPYWCNCICRSPKLPQASCRKEDKQDGRKAVRTQVAAASICMRSAVHSGPRTLRVSKGWSARWKPSHCTLVFSSHLLSHPHMSAGVWRWSLALPAHITCSLRTEEQQPKATAASAAAGPGQAETTATAAAAGWRPQDSTQTHVWRPPCAHAIDDRSTSST